MTDQGIEVQVNLQRSGAEPFSLDVSTQLPGSGVTAVFGPSGSGKTSLLRCVAGLETSAQGRVMVKGQLWQDQAVFVPTHQRPIGYVFQEASLFAHLSAAGNLNFARKRAHAPVNDTLFRRIIEVMGLKDLLGRRPAELSGGERQRVAIARALLIQPQLLLMDEPLASLDEQRKQEILPFLERLRSDVDIPILYVSHAINEVVRLADYAIILDQGRLVTQGLPADVFSHHPNDISTDTPQPGDDVGVIVEGTCTEQDSHWHLTCVTLTGGSKLWISADQFSPSAPVRLRVLARDVSIALSSADDSSILNRLPCVVKAIDSDPATPMAVIHLQAGEDQFVARVTRRSVAHLDLAPDKPVWAQIKSVAILR